MSRLLAATLFLAALPGFAGDEARPAAPTSPTVGTYRCSIPNAGGFELLFNSATEYATRYPGKEAKKGDYKTGEGGRFELTSGPLKGNYGKVLSAKKVGLSSKPTTRSFYATCDLR